eukprot:8104515-Lingulodinium_polyedra.AAC.1
MARLARCVPPAAAVAEASGDGRADLLRLLPALQAVPAMVNTPTLMFIPRRFLRRVARIMVRQLEGMWAAHGEADEALMQAH